MPKLEQLHSHLPKQSNIRGGSLQQRIANRIYDSSLLRYLHILIKQK